MSACHGYLNFLALTPTDRFLYQKLRCHLTIEGKSQFTSDDFRASNLEQFLDQDRQHSIGTLFAKWAHHDLIKEVGSVRSKIPANHMRKIKLYEFVKT